MYLYDIYLTIHVKGTGETLRLRDFSSKYPIAAGNTIDTEVGYMLVVETVEIPAGGMHNATLHMESMQLYADRPEEIEALRDWFKNG